MAKVLLAKTQQAGTTQQPIWRCSSSSQAQLCTQGCMALLGCCTWLLEAWLNLHSYQKTACNVPYSSTK